MRYYFLKKMRYAKLRRRIYGNIIIISITIRDIQTNTSEKRDGYATYFIESIGLINAELTPECKRQLRRVLNS